MFLVTVSLVGVVVPAAVDDAVAAQMLADAEAVVGAGELLRRIAAGTLFHFGPDGSETATARHFVGRYETVSFEEDCIALHLILFDFGRIGGEYICICIVCMI